MGREKADEPPNKGFVAVEVVAVLEAEGVFPKMLPPVAGVEVVDVLEPNILLPFAPGAVAAPNKPLVAGAMDEVVFVPAPNKLLPAGLAAAFPKSSPPPVAVVVGLLGVLPKRLLPGVVEEEVPVLPKIPEDGNEEFAAPKMLTAGLLVPEPTQSQVMQQPKRWCTTHLLLGWQRSQSYLPQINRFHLS